MPARWRCLMPQSIWYSRCISTRCITGNLLLCFFLFCFLPLPEFSLVTRWIMCIHASLSVAPTLTTIRCRLQSALYWANPIDAKAVGGVQGCHWHWQVCHWQQGATTSPHIQNKSFMISNNFSSQVKESRFKWLSLLRRAAFCQLVPRRQGSKRCNLCAFAFYHWKINQNENKMDNLKKHKTMLGQNKTPSSNLDVPRLLL